MTTWRGQSISSAGHCYAPRDLVFPPLCLEDTFLSHASVQGKITEQMFYVKCCLLLLSAFFKESQTGR